MLALVSAFTSIAIAAYPPWPLTPSGALPQPGDAWLRLEIADLG
jgi:hypothetical protein